MIKIPLSKKVEDEIKELHWDWFEKNRLSKKKNTIGRYLGTKSEDEIKTAILGTRDDMLKLIGKLGKFIKGRRRTNVTKTFGYAGFSNSRTWNPYELCHKLGIEACPYCNRQYVFTIGSAKSKVVRPEMDHYFPKESYPYLSVSLFNLIPSCHICNHRKGKTNPFERDLVYPYQDEFGDAAKFQINPHPPKAAEVWRGDSKSFDVSIEVDSSARNADAIEHAVECFHLNKLYSAHKSDMKTLIKRFHVYNDTFIQELAGRIPDTTSGEIRKLLFGLPLDHDLEIDTPLSKARQDILKQLEKLKRNGKL